jgi:hypothetical protein
MIRGIKTREHYREEARQANLALLVLRAENERLRQALTEARGAIAHLDPMALGGQTANHPEDQEWFFRDELLCRIDSALEQGAGE